MILYLIKNNLKLMLRNKWVIFLMIMGPVISTAILSNVFSSLMKSYEGAKEFSVGYRMDADGYLVDSQDEITQNARKAGITLLQLGDGDVEELMTKYNCSCFVDFQNDTYTLYKKDGAKIEGMITEYFLYRVFHPQGTEEIKTQKVLSMPDIEANNYYGMIYNVFYLWYCFVSLSVVFASERKNKIAKKYLVTPVSGMGLVLAKAIPCILATILEMLCAFSLTTILFDIQWGNTGFALLLLCTICICSTCFGLFIVSLFRNLAISAIVIFNVSWVWGFVGGSFETYLFSSTPESLKRISPIYYINRTLVETSLTGTSSYTGECFIYLILLSVVCFCGACMVKNWGKGVRA